MNDAESWDGDDYVAQCQALLEAADTLGHTDARVVLIEEAIRLADAHQDVQIGYIARNELVEAGTFTGMPEKALVAFTWMLAQFDAAPDDFPAQDLYWRYKWVINSLCGFPQITRKQLADALDDMDRRFTEYGSGARSVAKLRYHVAWDCGELDQATALAEAWLKLPRDRLTDCNACEVDDEAEYLLRQGRIDEGLAKAGPILQGRLRCTHVPRVTYASLVVPLWRHGLVDQAREFHKRGRKQVSGERDLIRSVAEHLEFAALSGERVAACKLIERNFQLAWETTDLLDQFYFLQACSLWLQGLQAAGETHVRLRLPRAIPFAVKDGNYELAALRGPIDVQLAALAERFDARNGNARYQELIAQIAASIPTVADAYVAAKASPSPSTARTGAADIVVGGLYANAEEDGSFSIVKVLVLDDRIVHLRAYATRFAALPERVDSSQLSMGSIDSPDGFGIGHFPLDRRAFFQEPRHLVGQEDVLDEELEGYRLWAGED